jgi:hypothetical protein
MTANDICVKLSGKFPQFLKAEAAELAEIEDALKGFAPTDLDQIWNEFRDTWAVNYCPRRAAFLKIASSLNIRKSSTPIAYSQLCYFCCANGRAYSYSLDHTKCPVCGSNERPFQSLCRTGTFLSREKAQEIIDRYPRGPHILASKKEGKTMSVRMIQHLDNLMGKENF